ncbi:hypothetical protein NSK_000782 [Nannochloropsis salina CCMP1776]|uniref:Protein kinase domain-containing protein n=1 Tax=Nannochloropsis salina CCMP1776 TaxID=1027361 RepID=A0A4D9D8P4_9STRA|nr:hypothetical protein NSK_000782 [Nannochloropsis salina CCMP1776]|eukprot:TFJ87962.1 hypothetical protein NSK_000782 [Nannochloropsis salina CCMP1776]
MPKPKVAHFLFPTCSSLFAAGEVGEQQAGDGLDKLDLPGLQASMQGRMQHWGEHMQKHPKDALKVASVAMAAMVTGTVVKNPMVKRQCFFWFRAFPVYLHYRWTEAVMKARGLDQEEQNLVWDRLHNQHANHMLAMVKQLKGYYVKICQFSSSRLDILPHIWIDRFTTLQDDVPPKPGHEIIRIVESSYGRPIEEIFEFFDADRPLGSASIGQCHLAKLKVGREGGREEGREGGRSGNSGGRRGPRGSGQLVAVKIQYPEAESCFNSDMTTLRRFAEVGSRGGVDGRLDGDGIAQPAYVKMLDEVRRQFMSEFDYRRESMHQDAIRIGLSKAGFGKAVTVPRPLLDLCTKEVLVMEYIPGVKLTDMVRSRPSGAPQQKAGFWARTLGAYYNKRYARYLVDTVVRVHGHQILKMGVFNGDPHPGNILLMPSGRIGLIDYGQIKSLKQAQRKSMARMIIALADGKKEEVIDLFVKMGFRSKRMDADVINAVATLYFDRDDSEFIGKGVNLQVYFENLQKKDPFLAMPEDFVMCARVAVFMRGLGTFLDYPISIAKAWRPLAVEVLKEKDITGLLA